MKNVEKPVICMHTNLQHFLGVRGCGTAHEGDRPCFCTCFCIYVFMFSSPLGTFYTSSPRVFVWCWVQMGSAFQPNMAGVQRQDFAGKGPVLFPDGIEVGAQDLGSPSHSTTILPFRIYEMTNDDGC